MDHANHDSQLKKDIFLADYSYDSGAEKNQISNHALYPENRLSSTHLLSRKGNFIEAKQILQEFTASN